VSLRTMPSHAWHPALPSERRRWPAKKRCSKAKCLLITRKNNRTDLGERRERLPHRHLPAPSGRVRSRLIGRAALLCDDYGVLRGGGGIVCALLAALVFGDVLHHGGDELAAEVFAEEVVENRVNHAVEQREAVYDVVEEVEEVGEGAVEDDVVAVEGEQREHDVEGQPADEEHANVGIDEQAVLPALRLGALDEPGRQDVENGDNGEGDEEPDGGGGQADCQRPLIVGFEGGHEDADGLSGVDQLHVSNLQERDGCCQDPAAGADDAACTVLVLAPEEGGTGQGHVAIHAQAGEEEDAGIHVSKVEVVGEAAEEAAPEPGVVQHHLQHPDGQREQHAEVSNSHVDDVEVDQTLVAPCLPVDPDDKEVLHQAHHENDQVKDEEDHPLDVLIQAELAEGVGVVQEVEQLGPVVVVPVLVQQSVHLGGGSGRLGHPGSCKGREGTELGLRGCTQPDSLKTQTADLCCQSSALAGGAESTLLHFVLIRFLLLRWLPTPALRRCLIRP